MPKLLVGAEPLKKIVTALRPDADYGITFRVSKDIEDEWNAVFRALTPVSEGGEAVPFVRLSECPEAVEAFLDAYGIDESEHEQHGPEIEAALRAAEEAAGY